MNRSTHPLLLPGTPRQSDPREWAPERFNLAIFRLLASLVLRTRGRSMSRRSDLLLAVSPYQSALEVNAISLFLGIFFALAMLTLTNLTAMGKMIVFPIVVSVGNIVFSALLTVFSFGVGILFNAFRQEGSPDLRRVQGVAYHVVVTLIALIMLNQRSAVRWAGAAWLALVALNAFAAVLLRLAPRLSRFDFNEP